MSGLDAHLLSVIGRHIKIPIARYNCIAPAMGFITVMQDLTTLTFDDCDYYDIAASISSLERLGVAAKSYGPVVAHDHEYRWFYKNDILSGLRKNGLTDPEGIKAEATFEVEKGLFEITEYGRRFCAACIPQDLFSDSLIV